MKSWLFGGICALVLAGIGMFWWQGRAEIERGAPPPVPMEVMDPSNEPDIPVAEDDALQGPAPPEATELTREQRRFFRYDGNRDWKISRNEMLSSRTEAFRKLDKDGNNLLTFEEWAVTTVDRFDGVDADGNRNLTPAEFATTAPKRKAKPACRC